MDRVRSRFTKELNCLNNETMHGGGATVAKTPKTVNKTNVLALQRINVYKNESRQRTFFALEGGRPGKVKLEFIRKVESFPLLGC